VTWSEVGEFFMHLAGGSSSLFLTECRLRLRFLVHMYGSSPLFLRECWPRGFPPVDMRAVCLYLRPSTAPGNKPSQIFAENAHSKSYFDHTMFYTRRHNIQQLYTDQLLICIHCTQPFSTLAQVIWRNLRPLKAAAEQEVSADL